MKIREEDVDFWVNVGFLIAAVIVVSICYIGHKANSSACSTKGGVYVEGTCFDKKAVIE